MTNVIEIIHLHMITNLALNVSLTSTGDPRELFIMLVNTHLPELQLVCGFSTKTEGESVCKCIE